MDCLQRILARFSLHGGYPINYSKFMVVDYHGGNWVLGGACGSWQQSIYDVILVYQCDLVIEKFKQEMACKTSCQLITLTHCYTVAWWDCLACNITLRSQKLVLEASGGTIVRMCHYNVVQCTKANQRCRKQQEKTICQVLGEQQHFNCCYLYLLLGK